MLERLTQLENNVSELSAFKKQHDLRAVQSSLQTQWTLRYGLFESIQIVVDIACHLSAKYNLGNPKMYSECIELLTKHNYIKEPLAERLYSMVGLRNLLIHEYVEIDVEQLYSFLNYLDDFVVFAHAVKEYV
ncbi:MAG: DUF86 domain-containing protein [candidate division KSB1 bacterium]|nr:DUF86 domain-containing protein [candidate division KSB1 bacterium]